MNSNAYTLSAPLSRNSYFCRDYTQCRQGFLHLARRIRIPIKTVSFATEDGTEYSIDTAYLGPDNPKRIILIVSGTHGVEGFAGSACQCAFLDAHRPHPEIAFLLVHALNPWGFAHCRRVNENNVDLNRNFIEFKNAIPENPDYARYHGLLLPGQWTGPQRVLADLNLYFQVLLGRKKTMQRAISAGQYAFADGLFYGGSSAQWSNRAWNKIISDYSGTPLSVVDLHTGLGKWGQCSLLSNMDLSSECFSKMQTWLGDALHSSDRPDSIGTKTSGALIDTLPVESLSVVFEFGTYSTVRVLNALRREALEFKAGVFKNRLMGVFCPEDPRWRQSVLAQFFEKISTYTNMVDSV